MSYGTYDVITWVVSDRDTYSTRQAKEDEEKRLADEEDMKKRRTARDAELALERDREIQVKIARNQSL